MKQKEFAKFLHKNKATILLWGWNDEVCGLILVLRKVTGCRGYSRGKAKPIWTVSFDEPISDECTGVGVGFVLGYSVNGITNIDGLHTWFKGEGKFVPAQQRYVVYNQAEQLLNQFTIL
jgi:hypothetical protein